MILKNIKVGQWYETKYGIGQCLRVGGTHPPSCEFNIVWPFPRGKMHVAPREVLNETKAPEQQPPAGGGA